MDQNDPHNLSGCSNADSTTRRYMTSRLGVIGGYGAVANEAFISFLNHRVLSLQDQSFNDSDFPDYLLINFPKDHISTHGTDLNFESLENDFTEIANSFKAFSITDIVILCNSFHIYETELRNIFSEFKYYSLVEIAHPHLDENTVVFCSQVSAENHLFGKQVTYYCNDDFIHQSVLRNEINLPDDLLPEDNQKLFLGCTDLSWRLDDFKNEYSSHEVLDSLDLFADFWKDK